LYGFFSYQFFKLDIWREAEVFTDQTWYENKCLLQRYCEIYLYYCLL